MKHAQKTSSTYRQGLSRREIIEGLKRQGLYGLSKIKTECRRFERSWDMRMTESECHEHDSRKRFSWR
jgi:hypothetical protein